MLVRILNFFRGYVHVLVSGYFIERFLNICIRRNIYLWDIKKKSPNEAAMKMTLRGFKSVRPVARKTHTRVHIVKKKGFPILMHRYRKRYFFFGGILLMICFLLIMSQFVWSINVVGNERVSTQIILDTLKDLGFYQGCYKGSYDVVDLKNQALLRLDELSWLWVDVRGSRATVNVKEKSPAPEILDQSTPCDIVAKKAGVIKSFNATAGLEVVNVGDTVQQGQVLISGVITSERVPARYTHATGEVFARTWYEESGEYSTRHEIKTYTTRQHNKHSISLFGIPINFYINSSIPYEYYDTIESEQRLSLFGLDLGITLHTKSYQEYTLTYEDISEEKMLSQAEEELKAAILARTDENAPVMASNLTHEKTESGAYKVTLTMEFTEQIGEPRQIDTILEALPTAPPEGTF